MTPKTRVVVDASMLLPLALPELPYAGACRAKVAAWHKEGVQICVPPCWVTQATGFLVAHFGERRFDYPFAAMMAITNMSRLRFMPASRTLAFITIDWAVRLQRAGASSPEIKSEYLALAERLDAELWTADPEFYAEARDLHYVAAFEPEPDEEMGDFDAAWLADLMERKTKEAGARRIHLINEQTP